MPSNVKFVINYFGTDLCCSPIRGENCIVLRLIDAQVKQRLGDECCRGQICGRRKVWRLLNDFIGRDSDVVLIYCQRQPVEPRTNHEKDGRRCF